MFPIFFFSSMVFFLGGKGVGVDKFRLFLHDFAFGVMFRESLPTTMVLE